MDNVIIDKYSFIEGGFAEIKNNIVYRNKYDNNLEGVEALPTNWKSLVPLFPYHRLYLITDGNATFKLSDSTYLKLEKDTMYLIPPFTVESIENDETISHFFMHFKPESSFLNPFECYDTLSSVKCSEKDHETFKILLNNYSVGNIESDILSHGCFFMLLSKFFSKDPFTPNHSKMLPIIQYIDANMYNDLSLHTISSHFGYSESYFSTMFSKLFCVPYIKYITDKKILIAKRLLAMSDKHLSEIAIILGYTDESYFNTLFKRNVGISPGKWRDKFMKQ